MKIVLYDKTSCNWLVFKNPVQIFQADTIDTVLETLRQVENTVNQHNLYAAGYIAYEAAPAFDPAFAVHEKQGMPLLIFGLYQLPEQTETPFAETPATFILNNQHASVPYKEYIENITKIKSAIQKGVTYQVNYTFPLLAEFQGDPQALFRALTHSQKGEHSALIEFDQYAICSASPELFFTLQGEKLVSRPMKGTLRRGNTLQEDRQNIADLYNSVKARAENVMIVDMIRNDMGRIAKTGTVTVPELYHIERYPTVLQMTSTVECETSASVTDIITALFPCASITGAPKVKTMSIIKSIEQQPRGVYTGAIGYIAPGRRASFNVAIRTAIIDKNNATFEYGIGGGIVQDSDADEEYEECLLKAAILASKPHTFQLLESILWEPASGYFLLQRHLQRLQEAAEYFGYPVNILQIEKQLEDLTHRLFQKSKIRVLVDVKGRCDIEWIELPENYKQNIKICLSAQVENTNNPFFNFKTTRRELYDEILARHPGFDDVIIVNQKGEITESCFANIVVRLNGQLYTPPVTGGLLAGTFRAELLEQGEICERIITQNDLLIAQEIFLINSVRKWVKIVL